MAQIELILTNLLNSMITCDFYFLWHQPQPTIDIQTLLQLLLSFRGLQLLFQCVVNTCSEEQVGHVEENQGQELFWAHFRFRSRDQEYCYPISVTIDHSGIAP